MNDLEIYKDSIKVSHRRDRFLNMALKYKDIKLKCFLQHAKKLLSREHILNLAHGEETLSSDSEYFEFIPSPYNLTASHTYSLHKPSMSTQLSHEEPEDVHLVNPFFYPLNV